MRRYTYFEAGKWRIKVGDVEFAGPWVDKLSYYEELAPNLENTKDEAYNLGYQTCLHAKELTWSEARELQAYRATGLTVERAAELGKADSEGRVVVLPVGPEDTVYEIKRCSTKEAAAKGVHLDRKKVGRYSRDYIFPRNRPLKIVERKMVKSLYAKIGKTVFLTREEAEKALEAKSCLDIT